VEKRGANVGWEDDLVLCPNSEREECEVEGGTAGTDGHDIGCAQPCGKFLLQGGHFSSLGEMTRANDPDHS
jgi:hypothetical protein